MSLFGLIIPLFSCGHESGKQEEVLYVTAAPQTSLRDRVAPVYSKTGTVRNGDRVVVLEHGKRWERVRNAQDEQGWLQDRYLVGEDVFRGFQQLSRDHQGDPVQARGSLRNDFRLHLTPGRDTDRLFLVKEGDKVELLQRVSVSRAASSAPPPPNAAAAQEKTEEKQDTNDVKEEEKEYKGKPQPPSAVKIPAPKLSRKDKARHDKLIPSGPPVPMEDWWLVRGPQGHAGWLLGQMIDVDVPLEVAQYAEGQRIVAYFPLTTVHDSELNKDVPYYLVLLTEPKDGLPFDYNQLRVFSWNVRKHRYETAYRDRNIFGLLPVSVAQEKFEQLGDEPTFTIHVRDEDGRIDAQKYRLEGVMVRRVTAPGEPAVKAARAKPERGKRNKE